MTEEIRRCEWCQEPAPDSSCDRAIAGMKISTTVTVCHECWRDKEKAKLYRKCHCCGVALGLNKTRGCEMCQTLECRKCVIWVYARDHYKRWQYAQQTWTPERKRAPSIHEMACESTNEASRGWHLLCCSCRSRTGECQQDIDLAMARSMQEQRNDPYPVENITISNLDKLKIMYTVSSVPTKPDAGH